MGKKTLFSFFGPKVGTGNTISSAIGGNQMETAERNAAVTNAPLTAVPTAKSKKHVVSEVKKSEGNASISGTKRKEVSESSSSTGGKPPRVPRAAGATASKAKAVPAKIASGNSSLLLHCRNYYIHILRLKRDTFFQLHTKLF